MLLNKNDTLHPCPFSKGYGIATSQGWLLLKIFFIYRFISASLFVLMFLLRSGPLSMGKFNSVLYQFASLGYLGISLLLGILILLRIFDYAHLAQTCIFTDILFITLLMHACGGVSSGIGALLAVSIAAGGVLIGGRCAILFAALAALAVLAEESYELQQHSFNFASLNYSGVLGISFFAIASLSVILAQRVEQSASLVKHHAQAIIRLEELNRYIIQHLQSGIMLIDMHQDILLCNHSALRLLGLKDSPVSLQQTSDMLQQAFHVWCEEPEKSFAIITVSGQDDIQVRFSQLLIDDEQLFMMLLEDVMLYNQRLQQSKLASLGRLTASIAHEIRNPLSAISHAGQLLSESPVLPAQDKRLTEIILNHCHRVNAIIEDILKLSRRNPSQRQSIALEQWLTNYIQDLNQQQNDGVDHFRLSILQSGLNASCDARHLKQILDNLCSNALKYGHPEQGVIVLELDRIADAPCIHIIDNGKGIDHMHRQHLFEPFFTTSHHGTGLGLYISRELAELNKADLSYAKYRDKTCFTLSLANAAHTVIEI